MKHKFSGHPEVSFVLFEHLRDNGVSKADHEVILKKMKALEDKLEQVRKLADRATMKKKKEGD